MYRCSIAVKRHYSCIVVELRVITNEIYICENLLEITEATYTIKFQELTDLKFVQCRKLLIFRLQKSYWLNIYLCQATCFGCQTAKNEDNIFILRSLFHKSR
jgi:hypothetical protein